MPMPLFGIMSVAYGAWLLLSLGGFVFLIVSTYRMAASLRRIEAILSKKQHPEPTGDSRDS